MESSINQIQQFIDQRISAEELQNWAIKTLHSIIKTGMQFVENLKLWGILSILTDLDAIRDGRTIPHLLNVLQGIESETFCSVMKVPAFHASKPLSALEDFFRSNETGREFDEECREAFTIVFNLADQKKTVYDLLSEKIKHILQVGFEYDQENGTLLPLIKSTILVDEMEEEIISAQLAEQVLHLLECMNGKRSFLLIVEIQNGTPSLRVEE